MDWSIVFQEREKYRQESGGDPWPPQVAARWSQLSFQADPEHEARQPSRQILPGQPVPIRQLIDWLGIKITSDPQLPLGAVDFTPREACLYLPFVLENDLRFIAASLLGHALLHPPGRYLGRSAEGAPVSFPDTLLGKFLYGLRNFARPPNLAMERRANLFALELLLPSSWVGDQPALADQLSPDWLAANYRVTRPVAEFRLDLMRSADGSL